MAVRNEGHHPDSARFGKLPSVAIPGVQESPRTLQNSLQSNLGASQEPPERLRNACVQEPPRSLRKRWSLPGASRKWLQSGASQDPPGCPEPPWSLQDISEPPGPLSRTLLRSLQGSWSLPGASGTPGASQEHPGYSVERLAEVTGEAPLFVSLA